jgi:hypothetical protein
MHISLSKMQLNNELSELTQDSENSETEVPIPE